MNWNNIPSDERLHLWKKLRNDISDRSLVEQMTGIAEFFADVPFGARTLDYYSPEEWPTPWEILFHGTFCKSSISLLMFYTFTLLYTDKTAELHLIDDGQDVYLLPVIDCQFVLNYHLGMISNYSNISGEFEDKQIFAQQQIKKIT